MISQGYSIAHRRADRSSNYAIKGLFALLLSVGFFLYKFTYFMDFTHPCIYDFLHDKLYPINRMINNDPSVFVILIGQVLIDVLSCTLLAHWLFWHHNLYMINFACVFYTIRTLYLQIVYFPFPEDIVWRASFIPSIMVPYDRTRDFFFSGHTGLALIFIIQYSHFKFPKWVIWICYFTLAWMPFMLIATHVHYTIDVIAAPFYLKISYHINELYKKQLDYAWSIPYVIVDRVNKRYFQNAEVDNKLMDDNLP